MAKVQFIESGDWIEARHDGESIKLDFYPGDTRPHAVKVQAIQDSLQLRHEELARRRGRPLPEKPGAEAIR